MVRGNKNKKDLINMSEVSDKCLLCETTCKKTSAPINQAYNINCQICGNYTSTREFETDLDALYEYPKNKKHLISGFIRNKCEHKPNDKVWLFHEKYLIKKNEAILEENSYKELYNKLIKYNDIDFKIQNILMYIKKNTKHFGCPVNLNIESDYPLFYAKNSEELKFLLESLSEKQYIKTQATPRMRTLL
jgi:hypothetical protein